MEGTNKNINTRQNQFEILIDFMCSHPDLSKGYLKTADARRASNNLWKRLASDLNAAGPPMREDYAWKKVWADYKNNIKSKARKNKNCISGTGGGPSKYCSFNAFEEKVIELLQINEAVNGMVGTKDFGGNEKEKETTDYEIGQMYEAMMMDSEMRSAEAHKENSTPPISNPKVFPKSKQNLHKTQVENQIEYQKNSHKMFKEINGNLRNILRYKRKQFELDEKYKKKQLELDERRFELEKEKFEFKKKNEVEKSRINVTKLELKKQIFELKTKSQPRN